jgi:hypothetical protein
LRASSTSATLGLSVGLGRVGLVRFFFNALRFFRSLGVRVHRVMTDTGSRYLARALGQACPQLGQNHTSPPKTTDVIDKCFLAGSEVL